MWWVKTNSTIITSKKKILECIFYEKFENLNLRVATTPFTPEIVSILNASKVLGKFKNKKEVKNDLLSIMAPPITRSCNQHLVNLRFLERVILHDKH